MNLKIKRVYDASASEDGTRILVDRLWPRGLTKERAHVDLWLKQVAPSTELRKWFAHDPAKWTEFKSRYRAELKSKQNAPNFDLLKQEQPKAQPPFSTAPKISNITKPRSYTSY